MHQPAGKEIDFPKISVYSAKPIWRDGRAVEGARLESVYTSKAYRGFESLPLRQTFIVT